METLSALFTAISERFTGAAWFELVKWPFWACVILIAFGGVYTASFRKNTLLCRGITGGLKLALIYLCCFWLHRLVPNGMKFVTEFPLMTITEKQLILDNPLALLLKPFSALPTTMVPLYFLLFSINACGSVDYGGRSKLAWFGSQLLSCPIGLGLYLIVGEFIVKIWTKLADVSWLYLIIGALLLLPLSVLMFMKLFFIIFRKAGNPTYAKIMQFLTGQPFGSLFSVTFFSLVSVLVFTLIINLWDMAEMTLARFNGGAYALIVVMCTFTLLIYSMYFTERKAG